MVFVNGASEDPEAPFGGYKMSGNGREWGEMMADGEGFEPSETHHLVSPSLAKSLRVPSVEEKRQFH
jgi:acyl-CoA reductase-like NAD-dependent aldehyde dehydrogenase